MDEQWQRLDLTPEQMEVLVHLTLRPAASDFDRVRDVWPHLTEDDGLARLHQAVEGINVAASSVTGKPGAAIGKGTSAALGLTAPELHVSVLGDMRASAR